MSNAEGHMSTREENRKLWAEIEAELRDNPAQIVKIEHDIQSSTPKMYTPEEVAGLEVLVDESGVGDLGLVHDLREVAVASDRQTVAVRAVLRRPVELHGRRFPEYLCVTVRRRQQAGSGKPGGNTALGPCRFCKVAAAGKAEVARVTKLVAADKAKIAEVFKAAEIAEAFAVEVAADSVVITRRRLWQTARSTSSLVAATCTF